MDPILLGGLGLVGLLVLLALRVPIGFALIIVSMAGIGTLRGWDVAAGMLRTEPFDFAARWSFTAIPMFLLMGAVAHNAGISASLFHAGRVWFGRLPGGLAVATNFACAGFAAVSGSSIATAAAMARIAIPEMTRYGYHKGLATGVVASAGTLGSMIPPSIGFILYGIFAEVSISKLFIAGILPGLLTAAIYAIMIITRCRLNPKLAPILTETVTWADRVSTLNDIWPIAILMVAIIGGLYSGIATPTEVGAVGALTAFLIALLQRRLTWKILIESLLDALESSARIFFIAVGAVMLTRFLAMSGFGGFMTHTVGGWAQDPLLLVIAASVIYLILGMFLDPLGVLLLSLPLLLPMFEALHLNLIWFGVLVVKYVEIGLLTPPVGLNVYMVKSVVGDEIPLETIFWGAGWFLACEVVIVILLVSFPEISLFLPNLMK